MGFTSRVLCLLTRLVTRPQTPSKICDGFYASSLACADEHGRVLMSLPFTEHIPVDQTNYGITPDTLARQKEPPLRHPSLPHIHAEFYCFPNVFPTRNPVFQFYPVDHAQLVQMPSLHTAKEIEGTPPALYSKCMSSLVGRCRA